MASTLDAIIVYKEMKQFLASIRFSDFEYDDILQPTSQRLIQTLNAIINYVMFRDTAWDNYEPHASSTVSCFFLSYNFFYICLSSNFHRTIWQINHMKS
jgi:hypothetical protein